MRGPFLKSLVGRTPARGERSLLSVPFPYSPLRSHRLRLVEEIIKRFAERKSLGMAFGTA
jgi:hypothetical protein